MLLSLAAFFHKVHLNPEAALSVPFGSVRAHNGSLRCGSGLAGSFFPVFLFFRRYTTASTCSNAKSMLLASLLHPRVPAQLRTVSDCVKEVQPVPPNAWSLLQKSETLAYA